MISSKQISIGMMIKEKINCNTKHNNIPSICTNAYGNLLRNWIEIHVNLIDFHTKSV